MAGTTVRHGRMLARQDAGTIDADDARPRDHRAVSRRRMPLAPAAMGGHRWTRTWMSRHAGG
jgi:hypothetical protein